MNQEVRLFNTKLGDNRNKFYFMIPDLDGETWTARWGRVGAKGQEKEYPLSLWDRKFDEKLRKGYENKTETAAVSNGGHEPEDDAGVQEMLDILKAASRQAISNDYVMAEVGSVTRAQVDETRKLLNGQLESILMALPRKTGNLRDWKLDSYDAAQKRLVSETDLLESLAGQVIIGNTTGQKLSEAMHMTFTPNNALLPELFPEYPYVKDHDGGTQGKVVNFWQVSHGPTQKRFDEHVASDPHSNVALYIHGSKLPNMMMIFDSGLLARPPGVPTNGDMFGSGIYFADQAMKSLRYCGLHGVEEIWTKGAHPRVYLMFFKVNVGRQYHLKYKGDHKRLNVYDEDEITLTKLRPYKYDSVFVHEDYKTAYGQTIYNREFIIFEPARATLVGLAEVVSA